MKFPYIYDYSNLDKAFGVRKFALLLTHIYYGCRQAKNCPKGAAEQSPGLAAFFAANPGYRKHFSIYPERGCVRTQPFQGRSHCGIFPRVGRKKRGQPWALIFGPVGAMHVAVPHVVYHHINVGKKQSLLLHSEIRPQQTEGALAPFISRGAPRGPFIKPHAQRVVADSKVVG
jgi:hypothetical protein